MSTQSTIKQQVIRKTLTGNWEEYAFGVQSKSFFVKNFTDDPIYVSFENNDEEDESIKIPSQMAEIVYISSLNPLNGLFFTDKVYVKGTGEVEVEAIEWL